MAKRFKFRLEAVLEVRQSVEDQRKVELGKIQSQINAIRDQLAGQKAERETSLKELNFLEHESTPNLQQIRMMRQYIAALSKKTTQLHQEVKGLEAQAELRRQELVEAAKERRSIEILKERDQAAWQKALDLAEAKETDEIAGQLATRNRKGDRS